MSAQPLPVPPQELRVAVGPFADADLFARSGDQTAAEIVRLCKIAADAAVLEVGCGCGRVARSLAAHLGKCGAYEGFDVSRSAIDWCRQNLQPLLPNFRFSFADIHSANQNPDGKLRAASFEFPYDDNSFDAAIASSVITHLLPDETENYLREIARVLKSDGRAYVTALLLDLEARAAVANGDTIFDFRHPVGACMTFDPKHPEEGIACPEDWLFGLMKNNGLHAETIQRGNWRKVRSYKISHDVIVAQRA